MNLHRSKMAIIKKSILHTFYYANNRITCIRCNITGKFVSIKKCLAKQKANVILSNAKASNAKASNAKANKPSNGYLSIVIMFLFIAIAYWLSYSTIIERQAQYNKVNNGNELLTNYYANCVTDTECEQLETKLNFDFKKGMN